MIEYITETGAFGYLWVIITLIFPFIIFKFIKRNPTRAIPTILPVVLILFLSHVLAKQLIGTTNYDTALTLIKDMWFIMYHVFLIAVFTVVDRELLDNVFSFKHLPLQSGEGDKNG